MTVVIENCKAEAGVVIGYTGQEYRYRYVRQAASMVSIRNCTSAATVYGVDKVGGLVGAKGQSMGSRARFTNSSFTGTVTASGNWVGGILGGGYEACVGTEYTGRIRPELLRGRHGFRCAQMLEVSSVASRSVKQCWGNGSGAITNNFFYGTVSGSSNVGADRWLPERI